MGGANSKEEFKKQFGHLIKKEEEKETEEESVSTHFINLASDQQITKDLKKIAEEKSTLIVVSNSKTQLKTWCFQPHPNKINRMQGFDSCNFQYNRLRENSHERAKKFDQEIRTRFENTSDFPHSVHGIVRVDLGKGNYKTGTGILIGSNLVLTAAHNIYDCKGTKEKYLKIEFIPGINEIEIPFGIFEVVESYVPDDFLKNWEQEDYALLVLSGAAGTLAGYFGLHIAEKELLKGKELNIIGYPGYVRTKDEKNELKILSKEGHHQLWGMKGKSWFFDDGENEEFLINYEDILTTCGQSGSAIFYQTEDTNEYYVIGIHVLGNDVGYSSATWINRKRYNQIEKWVNQSRRKLIAQKKTEYESRGGELWIKKLDLSKLHMKGDGLEVLSSYMMPQIESLDLSRNRISDTAILTLSQKTNWPNLRQLNLSANNITQEGIFTLGRNECWKDLTTLDLSENNIGAEGALALSANKSWANLSTLNLSSNSIGKEGAIALSQNSLWTNLITLNLSSNSIGAEGASALSANKSWANLSTLNLSSNSIGAEGATALSQNYLWTNLITLNLSENKIGTEGASALSENKSWANLSTLNLSSNSIGPKGARVLSQNKSWTNLTRLNLSLNSFCFIGATGLSQNKSWINLTILNLRDNRIGEAGATVLTQNKSWTNLTSLNLSKNAIGDEGVAALSLNESWINLAILNLSENGIGAKGVSALKQNKSWIELTNLNLYLNSIGDQGALALSQNKSWTNLTILILRENKIGADGATALSQNKSWTNLATLNLSSNSIGTEGATALSQNESWTALTKLDLSWNNIGIKGETVLKKRWPKIKLDS